MIHYILIGRVTNEDAAEYYSAAEGRRIRVGDPEFRVVGDPDHYETSEDFASLETLRQHFPDAVLPDSELTQLVRKPTSERQFTVNMSSETCADDPHHAIEMFLVQLASGHVCITVEENGDTYEFDEIPSLELNQFLKSRRT